MSEEEARFVPDAQAVTGRPPPPRPSTLPRVNPSPPQTPPPATAENRVHWLGALAWGFLMAIFLGAIWGLVLFSTRYVFWPLGLALGLAVAWALLHGGKRGSFALIPFVFILAFFAVFIGDVVAVSIAIGDPITALAIYIPSLGSAAVGYFFALVGAAFGAFYLYGQVRDRERRERAPSPPRYTGFPPPSPSHTATGPGAIRDAPSVEVRASGGYRVAAVVHFPGEPRHTVEVDYSMRGGLATVKVDGQQVYRRRVWGPQKSAEVSLPFSPPRRLSVRFYGLAAARLDLALDGVPLATV